MNTTVVGRYWLRFSRAPLLLRGYLLFAVVASILNFSVLFAPSLYEAILPYLGWSGLMPYLFAVFMAFSAIFTQQRKSIYGVVASLGFAMVFGAIDTSRHTLGPLAEAPNFDNPYLIYNPLRPVFTILLPALWLLLLITPRMRKWIKSPY